MACSSVCRLWREITKDVVKIPEQCGLLTFPISLKQVTLTLFTISCYVMDIYLFLIGALILVDVFLYLFLAGLVFRVVV